MPTELQIEKAIALIQKGGGNYEYFFAQLSNPSWIEPLGRRGRFEHPPKIEPVTSTSFRMPAWPEGQYLLRMAAIAPEEVAKVIRPACFASDNPQVHSLLVEIAALLPASAARAIATREITWLTTQRSLYILYSRKAAALVCHLADQGEIETALTFTRTILRVHPPGPKAAGKPIELEDGTTYTYRSTPEPKSRIESVWSQQYRSTVIPTLALAAGPALLADLAANLNTAVSIHCSNHEDFQDDYSTIWRQSLEHGSHYGTLDDTVSAVSDAIKVLVQQIPGSEGMVLQTLSQYKWPIFARLSAFALKTAPQVDTAALNTFVDARSRFDNPSANPEFRELLTADADNLTPDVLERILSWVDEGPDPARYEYHLKHRVSEEDVETVRASIIDQWQLDWLDALASALSVARQSRLEQLRQRLAPTKRFRVRGGAVSVQEQSPTDIHSFSAMAVEEIVTYLKTWVPASSGLPFERPSRSGLGTTLSQWVSENPQKATESVERFLTTDLDPIYITSILDAFSGLLRQQRPFDVYAVARAALWIAESTDALANPEEDGYSGQATWNWAQMSAARFMTDLMLQTDRLDLSRAAEVFRTVRALCFVPRPTPAEEVDYKKESSRYASFALNTPRPVGVEALIRFGRWIKLSTPEKDCDRELLNPVFEVLEQKLNASLEPSVAVREMFGMQFHVLAWLDQDWFMSVIPKLFPGKTGHLPQEKTLDRFAWNSYLLYGHLVLPTLPAMRSRYAAAIKSLTKTTTEIKETERTLANHLIRMYAHATIEIDDPLLVRFFESASPSLRAQAIGDIGWSIGQDGGDLDPTIQARFMRLFEHRLMVLEEASREEGEELENFGWWVHCEKFPVAWTIEQAMKVLEKQRKLSPDFAVAESFAKLAQAYPYEAVRVVHVLLEQDRDGWSVHGWDEHLDTILKAALGSGAQAKDEATAMIDLLSTRGFRVYRNLLT